MGTIVETNCGGNGTLMPPDFGIEAIVDKIKRSEKSDERKKARKEEQIGGGRLKYEKQRAAEQIQDKIVEAPTLPEAIPTNDSNNNTIENIQWKVNPRNFDHLLKLAELVRNMADLGDRKPRVGIICGSGLSALADQMEGARILPYAEVPGFPKTGVIGHKGNLVFGRLAGQLCVCLQGRFHPYEHQMDMALCTMPVRLMALLGVRTLIVSNAAGGINQHFRPGDLMIIKDHIFLPGLTGHSPLIGMDDKRFGAHFVSLHNAYNRDLRTKARELAHKLDLPVREGTYVMNAGPQYETAAECSLIARMGGDAIGMSTCHEVIVARQCGLRVFGFSLITNGCSLDADAPVAISHDEVLEAGARTGPLASRWVAELVGQMAETDPSQ